jgi:hypothetical protein
LPPDAEVAVASRVQPFVINGGRAIPASRLHAMGVKWGEATSSQRCGSGIGRPLAVSRAAWQCWRRSRPASSRVSNLAAARRARLLLAGDVGQRLPVGVADDEAPPMQLGVGLVDGPGRRSRSPDRQPAQSGPLVGRPAKRRGSPFTGASWLGRPPPHTAPRRHAPSPTWPGRRFG